MVINKNNLKHTWTRVPLLLLHRLSSLFFSFLFRNCSETRPPERLHPRPLRAPSAIGAIPRSVACPRSMLLSSAAPLGSPSRQSLFSTVSPLSATNDLCFLRFLSPFFFFFFNKVTIHNFEFLSNFRDSFDLTPILSIRDLEMISRRNK